jgi:hypothetical protein
MSETLLLPPFPPLQSGRWEWRADFTLPWYRVAPPTNPTQEKPQLIVRADVSRSVPTRADVPWQPTAAQTAAFRFLLEQEARLKPVLLAEFRKSVPELDGAAWDGLEAFFELAIVLVFYPALDEVSYTGLVFHCLQWDYGYEHGVGIMLHQDRIVHFGMAEEAQDETQALKDLRRIAWQRRSARSV